MKPEDLEDVNTEVNRFIYQSDAERYGRPEFWTELDGAGDCEDFAIAKLRRLLKRGWDIKRLRLACCWDENGGYHAVLMASAPDGDYMLDNRQPFPVPAAEIDGLGYRLDKIQAEGGSKEWRQWLGNRVLN